MRLIISFNNIYIKLFPKHNQNKELMRFFYEFINMTWKYVYENETI